jgi:uncharacterized protein with FMN-binding domain
MYFGQFLAILASNYPDRISCNIKESILWQGGTTMSARKVITSVLAVGTTIAIAIDGYLLFLKADQASSTASTASSSTSTATSSSASSSSSSASSSTSSGLKDGTYSGKSVSTQWGDVQVQIKVSGGKITTVNVLKYPSDNDHSQQINDQALPVYKKEAVEAQSADIQQVSGATVTYEGFTQSLQNAITQAKES